MNNGQSNNQGEFDEGLALDGDAATAMQNVAQALSMEDDDMTQGDTPENENGESGLVNIPEEVEALCGAKIISYKYASPIENSFGMFNF